jgi:hypothetical protein
VRELMHLARIVASRFLGVGALAIALNGLVAVARCDDSAWRVWLEPKFMRAAVAGPFGTAKKTELAAGVLEGTELRGFSKAEFAALGWDWETFSTLAKYHAAADLPSLRYSFARNKRGIITYARVESDKPVVASAVLIPGFLDLWQGTLGEKVLVVVPNRFTAFLFPRLASDYQEYSPMVFRAYRETPYPVSVEVFELGADGWRAFGAYEEP